MKGKGNEKFNRLLEIIPGFSVWFTFFLGIVLSFFQPLWVVVFMILFDLYWLFRVVYFVIFLLYGWWRFKQALHVDWFSHLQKERKDWKKIYHLIFLPTYQEDISIVESTFESLLRVKYPKDRFIVVLAGEERAKEHFELVSKQIQKKYGNTFSKLITTLHPKNMPGEIASKGANINYAGHSAKKYIDGEEIPYEDVIVSAFDIDTVAHPDYFACLTYTYLTHPNPTRSSYQPVVLYNNNIWDSPAPMRLAAFSTTVWLMTELARPDRLFTFSSHSMPFKALVDVDFWQKDIVSEDSRIFLQCFMHYNGDYTVTPLYVPVSMDTVMAPGLWRSLVNLYKQQRRWAWGVEHFPYMVKHFISNKKISFTIKIKYLWNQAEGMFTWATAPILILILGRLPLWVANPETRVTVLAQNAPFILETLLNLSMVGIFVIATISLGLLPARKEHHRAYRILYMIGQWFLLPLTIILFSSIPAIDAQTRLMFGRHLGFYVTEKVRKKHAP